MNRGLTVLAFLRTESRRCTRTVRGSINKPSYCSGLGACFFFFFCPVVSLFTVAKYHIVAVWAMTPCNLVIGCQHCGKHNDDGLQTENFNTVQQYIWFETGLWECLSVEAVVSDQVFKVGGRKNWGTWHFVLFWMQVVKLGRVKMRLVYQLVVTYLADPSGRAFKGTGLRPLACCDCELESRQRHGCLSLVSAVSCQGGVSANEPIPPPEESYLVRVRVCVYIYISLTVIRCNNNPVHLQRVGRRGHTKIES